ncbi:MAG: ion channel [Candidatus Absconditicoccaceae bacterium]
MKNRSAGKSFLKNVLFREILLVFFIILIGGFIFWKIEGLSFIDSIYFTTTTMATIGLGDIAPQTTTGKIFVMIYAFMGVPLFISLSGLILESRFNKRLKQYISNFHKELHAAELELQEVEDKVGEELGDVMKQEKKTEGKIDETVESVKINRKKIEKIEEMIQDNSTDKKPRWKIWKRK